MSHVRTQLEHTAEDLLRCVHALPEVEKIMRGSLAEPGGHDFEVISTQTVLYCETHERDLTECHRLKLFCEGVPVPALNDPTGDAAVHDAVWSDVRQLRRRSARIAGDVAWIVGMIDRWQVKDRVPVRDEKAKIELPLCEIHLRYGYDRPARSKGSLVKQNGRPTLTRPHALCEWCEDATRKLGRVPLEVEVHDHMAGKRLRTIAEDETAAEERRRERSA